jgi:hypothetical protein
MFDLKFEILLLKSPDRIGFCGCLFQSAESATGNRGRIGFDPSPERAGATSFALSGLASIMACPQGFHPWLLPVALSALRGSSFKPPTKSGAVSKSQIKYQNI